MRWLTSSWIALWSTPVESQARITRWAVSLPLGNKNTWTHIHWAHLPLSGRWLVFDRHDQHLRLRIGQWGQRKRGSNTDSKKTGDREAAHPQREHVVPLTGGIQGDQNLKSRSYLHSLTILSCVGCPLKSWRCERQSSNVTILASLYSYWSASDS